MHTHNGLSRRKFAFAKFSDFISDVFQRVLLFFGALHKFELDSWPLKAYVLRRRTQRNKGSCSQSQTQIEEESMTTKTDAKTQQMPYDAWKKMVDEQLGRIEGLSQEFARYQQQGMDQARGAIDELATLMKDSLDHTAQLTNEWRRMALDSTRKAGDMMRQSLSR
jgi:hypothetical protein